MDLPPPINVLRWCSLVGLAECSHDDQELHVQVFVSRGPREEGDRSGLRIPPKIPDSPASATPERGRARTRRKIEAGSRRRVLGGSNLERIALPSTTVHGRLNCVIYDAHLLATPTQHSISPGRRQHTIQLQPHVHRLGSSSVIDILIQRTFYVELRPLVARDHRLSIGAF